VGSGSTCGIITDFSEALGLDNLESELVGGTYGTVDRGGVCYIGSTV
jgi:hypothetical protein